MPYTSSCVFSPKIMNDDNTVQVEAYAAPIVRIVFLENERKSGEKVLYLLREWDT